MWAENSLEQLIHDLQYGLRTLCNNPGFTSVAVIVLSLGIGANTALFSVINGVLLRPLPYAAPQQLLAVGESSVGGPAGSLPVAPANLTEYLAQTKTLVGLAGWEDDDVTLSGKGYPERASAQKVTASFFDVLGVLPVLGHGFDPQDNEAAAPCKAVLSSELAQRRYGGGSAILDQPITVDERSCTVVGVLPQGFQSPDQLGVRQHADLWLPYTLSPEVLRRHDDHELQVVGRLHQDATTAQARAELEAIAHRLAQSYPEVRNLRTTVAPLASNVVKNAQTSLLVLFGCVGLVLVLACINVANLVLLHGVGRRCEIAIRISLGASRARLVRQLMVQNLELAAIAGTIGIALAFFVKQGIIALAPAGIPRNAVSLDGRVLLYTLLLSLFTGVLFGLFPAFQVSRAEPWISLRATGRQLGGKWILRWRNILMAGEVALALMLLIGAGLLLKSFILLTHVQLGFQPDHALSVQILLPEARYSGQQPKLAFFEQLLPEVRRLPGVQAAAYANQLPFRTRWASKFEVEHTPLVPLPDLPLTYLEAVSSDYFQALGIRILRGRGLTDADLPDRLPVVAINLTAARYYWGTEDPLGKRVRFGGGVRDAPWFTVVGITDDVHLKGQDSNPPLQLYFPAAQRRHPNSVPRELIVRTGGDPLLLVRSIQNAVAEIDPNQALTRVSDLNELVTASVAERWFLSLLLMAFAGFSLLLAAVGIYGVVAYAISQRTPEIGVRLALGAMRIDILGLVLRGALLPIFIGLVAGLLGSLALTRYLRSLLYGTATQDFFTLVVTSILLLLTALAAVLWPARRAIRVDPMVALRYD
jgi:putative ABC transport system permease protein